MKWLDLTQPLNSETWVYRDEGYSDPEFSAVLCASIGPQRYEAWLLGLATQMGTHIDAPSHFVSGGATMDEFLPEDCVGTYHVVTSKELTSSEWQPTWPDASHLFLDARQLNVATTAAVDRLLELPIKTIVMAGGLKVAHDDHLWFHQRVADLGKYLVEDLKTSDDQCIPLSGQIITTPLPLSGLSGSPTRVLVSKTIDTS